MTKLELKFIEKLKSVLIDCDYEHIKTLLNYTKYINDNNMYSYEYRHECISLIRKHTFELHRKDLEFHKSEVKRIFS